MYKVNIDIYNFFIMCNTWLDKMNSMFKKIYNNIQKICIEPFWPFIQTYRQLMFIVTSLTTEKRRGCLKK